MQSSAPSPWHFRPISVSKFERVICLKTVWSGLKRSGDKELLLIDKVVRVYLFDQNVCRYQRESYELQNLFEVNEAFLADVFDLQFELHFVREVKSTISSRPPQTRKIKLDFLETIMQTIPLQNLLQ